MSRGPRSTPALVVLALVGAAATVVWLARDDHDAASTRERARHEVAHVRAPRVDLAPVTSDRSPAAIAEAIERARAPQVDAAAEKKTPPTPRDPAGRDVDPPPSIRGVRGVVRDARTKAPIAGAWVTWRMPPPELSARVLGNDGLTRDAAGMISDGEGRFVVDRLPDDEAPSFALHAVARGYALTSLRPGLREDVVIDLVPAGALNVFVDDALTVVLEAVDGDPPRRVPSFGLGRVHGVPNSTPSPGRRHVGHLSPGPWRALVDGREVAATHVVEGTTTSLVIELPPMVDVTGELVGADDPGSVAFTALEAHRADPDDSTPLARDGRFSVQVRPGQYVVTFTRHVDETERRLPGVVDVVPGMPPLRLEAPPAGARAEVLFLTAGRPAPSEGLGLVALDVPADDPFGGDLVHLEPTDEPGVHVALAAPGRYAVFDGHDLVAAEVAVPTGGRFVVERRDQACRLRFLLPAELRPDEVLRARFTVIPDVIASRPALRERFGTEGHVNALLSQASPTVSVDVSVPGRYLLVGETDLGPLEVWADLIPGGEVTIPLPE